MEQQFRATSRHSRHPRSLRSYHLAALSKSVLDIPPRIRVLLLVIGVIGIALVCMESLVSRHEQTIELDKIIHFLGYGALALVFVLALRPAFFIPGLLGLVLMGFVIEILQGYTLRSPEWADAYANTLGVAVGGLLGLLIRGIYAYVRKELAVSNVKRNLIRFLPKDVIFREGQSVGHFFIIKTGNVQLTRQLNGKVTELGTASVGDVIGTLGVILGEPQYATAVALERVTLYRMNLDQMLESSGGEDLPVSLLLLSLTKNLKAAVDKLALAQIDLQQE